VCDLRGSDLRMATGQFWVGYPRVSGLVGSGSGVTSHPQFLGSGPETYRVRFRVWFSTRGYPMDI
jgi:hypothetical protein